MASGAVSTAKETSDAQWPLLSAVDIGKVFGDRVVLEHVSFSIQAGQIVTLIGPNGAGKTTLVRIALGLLDADSGTITRREGLRLGYMPQSLHVEPTLPLTVQRFLALALRGAKGSAGGREIAETLASLQIPHLSQSQLNSLSGGELQRGATRARVTAKAAFTRARRTRTGRRYCGSGGALLVNRFDRRNPRLRGVDDKP
jgi:ABC-type Mn2+/Zn2+ transport system ATPase subunit